MFNRSLSITIINNNHWRWLQGCLESLDAHPYTLGPSHVIVLDNASQDGSVTEIRRMFPDVSLLPRNTRRGFGANQNDAIDHAAGDLVFLLNPDAVVHSGTLDMLARAFDRDSAVTIAGGPDTGSAFSQPIAGPYPFPTPGRTLARAAGLSRFRRSEIIDDSGLVVDGWVSGHGFMVDRDRFVEIGGFDETFFLYSEEVDLMRRVLDRGWKIAWVSEALTTHVGKTSESANAALAGSDPTPRVSRTLVQFARSEVRYMLKHHGRRGSQAFRVAAAADAAVRYAATWLPSVGKRLVPKGPTIGHTRHHHMARLKVYLRPQSGADLEAYADSWNRENPAQSDVGH